MARTHTKTLHSNRVWCQKHCSSLIALTASSVRCRERYKTTERSIENGLKSQNGRWDPSAEEWQVSSMQFSPTVAAWQRLFGRTGLRTTHADIALSPTRLILNHRVACIKRLLFEELRVMSRLPWHFANKASNPPRRTKS